MDKPIYRLVDWMIDQTIISKGQREVILFGIRQAMIYGLNIITFLVISIVSSNYWGVLIYILTFWILRSYAGGYHANSEIGCYLSSTIMVFLVTQLMNGYELRMVMGLSLLVVGTFFLTFLGPIEDHNKPLDPLEHKIYRKRMIIILGIELTGILIAMSLQYREIVEAATYGLVSVAMVVILGWVKNHLRNDKS